MSDKRKQATKKRTAVLLNMPPELKSDIRRVAQQVELSEADVMRLAMRRGLERVELMFAQESKAA